MAKLIDRQANRRHLEAELNTDYFAGLNLFWQGRSRDTVEWVSSKLADADEAQPLLLAPFYRLWIEQLAEDGDMLSLRLLSKHLFMRSQLEPGQICWFALRGIVHLELDDWEACQLLAPTLLLHKDEDVYCCEFNYRLQLRSWDGVQPFQVEMPHDSLVMLDYFAWQALARTLLVQGQAGHDSLVQLIGSLEDLFPASPMGDLFGAHLAIDRKDYVTAGVHTNALVALYPQRRELQFLHGYVHSKLGRFNKAIGALCAARRLPGGAEDGDIYALLAHCYRARSGYDLSSDDWQLSYRLSRRAIMLYHRLGVPYQETSLPIHGTVQPQTTYDAATVYRTPEEQGFDIAGWLVYVDARRSLDLANLDHKRTQPVFQPCTLNLRKDDLVFFLSESSDAASAQRVVALYQASSRPFQHPHLGQVVALKLLRRFAEPIFVSLPNGQPSRRASNIGAKKRTAVPLSAAAFDVIRLAISEHADCTEATEVMDLKQYFALSS